MLFTFNLIHWPIDYGYWQGYAKIQPYLSFLPEKNNPHRVNDTVIILSKQITLGTFACVQERLFHTISLGISGQANTEWNSLH